MTTSTFVFDGPDFNTPVKPLPSPNPVFDGPDFNTPVQPLPSPIAGPDFNTPVQPLPSPIAGPDFNAPVNPLPFARVVVDAPTVSDPYVDTYNGTNDAEIFDVQTPYRNGKFDSPDKQAVVNAGGGDDIVNGSNATDVIAGGAGKDELYGNAGNDWLTGGSGNDTLTGGQGADVFEMSRGGQDIVTDFNYYEYDQVALIDFSGQVCITEYISVNGTDTVIEAGDTLMQFEGARAWQIYDSVMEQNNIQLVATNFEAPVGLL